MWAFSKYGFFSITRKGEDYYHIRGRSHRDLINLVEASKLDKGVIYGGGTDYDYRIIVDEEDFQRCFTALEESVDYPNFKNMINASPTQKDKSSFYMEIWAIMYDYQIQRGQEKDLDGLSRIFDELVEEVFSGNFPYDDVVANDDKPKYLPAFDDDGPMERATLKEWENFEAEIAKLRD
jgi:hypothetical protein